VQEVICPLPDSQNYLPQLTQNYINFNQQYPSAEGQMAVNNANRVLNACGMKL
jgi:hypothetical protein